MFSTRSSRGFTLIELAVVIGIVSVISILLLNAVGTSRAKSRDAQRKSDLRMIALALEQYHEKYNRYSVTGGGYNGGGQGWLSYENGSTYATAVTRVLYNEGLLKNAIIEDPVQSPGYMIYLCGTGTYALSATLERPTATDIAEIQASCNGVGVNGTYTVYGKNTVVTSQ